MIVKEGKKYTSLRRDVRNRNGLALSAGTVCQVMSENAITANICAVGMPRAIILDVPKEWME